MNFKINFRFAFEAYISNLLGLRNYKTDVAQLLLMCHKPCLKKAWLVQRIFADGIGSFASLV